MFFVGGVTGALGFKHIGFYFTFPLAALLLLLAIVPVLDDLRRSGRTTHNHRPRTHSGRVVKLEGTRTYEPRFLASGKPLGGTYRSIPISRPPIHTSGKPASRAICWRLAKADVFEVSNIWLHCSIAGGASLRVERLILIVSPESMLKQITYR